MEKDGLTAAARALAYFDADIEKMIAAVYAARAKAKDRQVPASIASPNLRGRGTI